jgi:hypothetical protein
MLPAGKKAGAAAESHEIEYMEGLAPAPVRLPPIPNPIPVGPSQETRP